MLTPRFVPSCTVELLKGLGDLAAETGAAVQSHISESLDEVAFAKALHPEVQTLIPQAGHHCLPPAPWGCSRACRAWQLSQAQVCRATAAVWVPRVQVFCAGGWQRHPPLRGCSPADRALRHGARGVPGGRRAARAGCQGHGHRALPPLQLLLCGQAAASEALQKLGRQGERHLLLRCCHEQLQLPCASYVVVCTQVGGGVQSAALKATRCSPC